ncbi:MAG: polyamine aminopropyltransferase [Candidatus Syntrophosphaera sp.]|nr:polyamine aminopropyltransferase [Candidatus Syntrophosphaera sp.]
MGHWHTDYHSPHRGLCFEVSEVLRSEASPYQQIEIVQTPSFGKVMLLDGVLMLTERDEFVYHEMLAHPALFTHPDPRSVLIIGGGDCGTIKRVLEHKSVRRVVQVELDELVTRVAAEYFPFPALARNDTRAELVFADGIAWVRETTEQFDVILIDSTDPVGPAEGLFRRPFFADCHRALAAGGILCLQSESPWIESLRKVIREMHHDLASLFPIVKAYGAAIQTYQAGLWLFQLASKLHDPLAPEIAARIDTAGLDTRYYHKDLHYGAFILPKFVNEVLSGSRVDP